VKRAGHTKVEAFAAFTAPAVAAGYGEGAAKVQAILAIEAARFAGQADGASLEPGGMIRASAAGLAEEPLGTVHA